MPLNSDYITALARCRETTVISHIKQGEKRQHKHGFLYWVESLFRGDESNHGVGDSSSMYQSTQTKKALLLATGQSAWPTLS